MFKHIVVPLDESSLAEQAIPVAAHIARAAGSSLQLIHVVHDPVDYAWQYGEATLLSRDIVEADYSRAETYLKELCYRDDLHGIQVTTEVLSGYPAQAILNACKTNQADMIVICSHGYTGVKRWLLGSVARKLLHQSNIPILLLRPTTDGPLTNRDANQGPLRVMVPLDGSSFSEEALAPAAALSNMFSPPSQGALHLSCVLPISKWEQQPFLEQDQLVMYAQHYLATLEPRILASKDISPQPSITTSITLNPDIAHALVNLAESGKGTQAGDIASCDVIAIATHGRDALTRWMIGSITERVLDTTRLPVLVIRPQKMSIYKSEEKDDAERDKTFAERKNSEAQSAWIGLL